MKEVPWIDTRLSAVSMWVGCVEKVGLSTEKARNGENVEQAFIMWNVKKATNEM